MSPENRDGIDSFLSDWADAQATDCSLDLHALKAFILAARAERDAELARLREALEDAENEAMIRFLRPDGAERAQCSACGAENFSPSGIEHRIGCHVGRIRAALTDGGEG